VRNKPSHDAYNIFSNKISPMHYFISLCQEQPFAKPSLLSGNELMDKVYGLKNVA
jgi:hypothetical protein